MSMEVVPVNSPPLVTLHLPPGHPLAAPIAREIGGLLVAAGGDWRADVEASPSGAAFAVRLFNVRTTELVSFVVREPRCTLEHLVSRVRSVLLGPGPDVRCDERKGERRRA